MDELWGKMELEEIYLKDFEIGTGHLCGCECGFAIVQCGGGVMVMVEIWRFWSGDSSEMVLSIGLSRRHMLAELRQDDYRSCMHEYRGSMTPAASFGDTIHTLLKPGHA